METKELMIGDWVKLKGSDFYFQVESIYNTGIRIQTCGYFEQHEIDKFEPIPLTQEILEKNGFRLSGGYNKVTRMYFNGNKLRINLIGGKIIIRHGCNGYTQDIDVKIDYIHELQHALRLCGLSNLADNFKIE